MLAYDDKRNFYRMMVNSACQVVIVDAQETQSMNAVCRDISATGMSIELETQNIENGTLLEITIESQSEQLQSLVAKSKVVRCDELTEKSCLVGVEISEMS
jgi:c-di-GMP-binding flagellar brake protein YcgR